MKHKSSKRMRRTWTETTRDEEERNPLTLCFIHSFVWFSLHFSLSSDLPSFNQMTWHYCARRPRSRVEKELFSSLVKCRRNKREEQMQERKGSERSLFLPMMMMMIRERFSLPPPLPSVASSSLPLSNYKTQNQSQRLFRYHILPSS